MGIETELVWLALHKALSSRPEALRRLAIASNGDVGTLVELSKGDLKGQERKDATAFRATLDDLE